MPNYQLVNPHIEGEFKSVVSDKTPQDAAQKIWSRLSGHLTNNVPKFGFTLEQVGNKKLHHFVVKETVDDGVVDYKLIDHDVSLSDNEIKALREKIAFFRRKMSGGKRKKRYHGADDEDDDDEIDLDDSTEVYSKIMRNHFVHQSTPIVYFWYNPLVYRLDYLYVPTFVETVMPYIQIDLSSAFFP